MSKPLIRTPADSNLRHGILARTLSIADSNLSESSTRASGTTVSSSSSSSLTPARSPFSSPKRAVLSSAGSRRSKVRQRGPHVGKCEIVWFANDTDQIGIVNFTQKSHDLRVRGVQRGRLLVVLVVRHGQRHLFKVRGEGQIDIRILLPGGGQGEPVGYVGVGVNRGQNVLCGSRGQEISFVKNFGLRVSSLKLLPVPSALAARFGILIWSAALSAEPPWLPTVAVPFCRNTSSSLSVFW